MTLSILGPDGLPFEGSIPKGNEKINSGKTKDVFPYEKDVFALRHNGILTAYDNPEFTGVCEEKGVASAYSSALTFKRLEDKGILTSHYGILNANTTLETALDMLPFEIIWRRYNVEGNSWAKRNPNSKYEVGERYDDIIYEVGLKWSVINENGEICHDPFIKLDDDFKPLLDTRGLPILTHQRTGKELNYQHIIHPDGKEGEDALEALRETMELFTERRSEIREIVSGIQEVTFDTYSEIGRLNADGKIELGLNGKKELILGDELELDALRNVSLEVFETSFQNGYIFDKDILGRSIQSLIGNQEVDQIIEARHSGKQHFRDQVKQKKDTPFDNERKNFNDHAARTTTKDIYIPTAMALSDKFSKEVGLTLSKT